jgi:aminoglycoside phosphotransferase (APT) family kinase protein
MHGSGWIRAAGRMERELGAVGTGMQRGPTGPPAAGRRLEWAAAPGWLRGEVEARLGGRVVEAATQPGGFSPGIATRLRLADGRRAFVKAVGPEPNPDSPGIHRSEARVTAILPRSSPAPRLLWSLDQRGWVALAFEDVDGAQPALPWRPGELRRVLGMVAGMAAALTPAPAGIPTIANRLGDSFTGWRDLAAARAAGDDDLDGLDPWTTRHLDRLADLEAGWSEAAQGPTLLHCDLRADNLLLTPTRVVAVDWPWACVGAAWVDLLLLLPSVTMQGGPDPEPTFAAHPVAAGVDHWAVTTTLAALAGFLVAAARLPPPPGLPTLRAFQLGQGLVALDWLRRRTGWS